MTYVKIVDSRLSHEKSSSFGLAVGLKWMLLFMPYFVTNKICYNPRSNILYLKSYSIIPLKLKTNTFSCTGEISRSLVQVLCHSSHKEQSTAVRFYTASR